MNSGTQTRRARKRFGQNFLRDHNVINRIVQAINPRPDDHILEIGPGRGALTDLLVRSGCQLDVIEIDRDLAGELRLKHPGLNIIEADVLKYDLGDLPGDRPLRIVGNLPYNISTPLMFRLFKHADSISDMFFMLQLEVVNRMTASHSTADYGRLSIMSQYFCATQKLFTVPPTAFTPQPKVMSAIIRLQPKRELLLGAETERLEEIVLQAFSMRRKTIRNALKKFVSATEIEALGLDPKSRPENLTLEDYARVAVFSQGDG